MNKNSKRKQAKIREARKNGNTSVAISVPVPNYHSNAAMTMITVPVYKGGGVVSENQRRNMRMRVLSNSGGGANSSLTVHEKIRDKEPCFAKPRREKKD